MEAIDKTARVMTAILRRTFILMSSSNLVKTPRVVAENRGFMLFFQIVALDDFVDFLHAVVEGDLVREIRREHEGFHADAFDGIGQSFFVAFAATKELAALEVVRWFALDAQAAVLQLPFQTVDDHGNPTGAAFQKADAQGREGIQYTVDDHTRRRNGQRYRHPQSAGGRKDRIG